METGIRETLWRQAGAAIDMLENAVDACPDELWSRPSEQMGFWFLAYHTLFFLDLDLTPAEATFVSPWFDVHEYEARNVDPPYLGAYAKQDVRTYLARCRERCRDAIAGLRAGERNLRGCERIDADAVEVVLYQIRHVQHHAAQLNLLLRQNVGDAPRWVRKAR